MPRSPGPLQQPRDPFGGTNLDDLIHRREVHPKVQAGGADHAPESAVFTFQHRFHTISKLPFQRAVVQGNFSEHVRRCQNQRAVPNLGLGPGVGEDDGAGGLADPLQHQRDQPHPDVTRPGEAFHFFGQKTFHFDGLLRRTTHQLRWRPVGSHQSLRGFLNIAQRGRNPPHAKFGSKISQAAESKVGLDAAFARKQLMPFITHHSAKAFELLQHFLVGQQQRQGLRGRDQNGRQFLALLCFLCRARVSGSQRHRKGHAQRLDRFPECGGGIRCQRPEGCDPDHPNGIRVF